MKGTNRLIAFALIAAMLTFSLPVFSLAETNDHPVPEGYNANDYEKALAVLETEDAAGIKNGYKLTPDYDPDDPETWSYMAEWEELTGFIWEDSGGELRLTSINCTERGFVGALDLSGCSELRDIAASCNGLDSVNVLGCTSLLTLNIWENHSITEVDVSECPELYYLDCEECDLSCIDVSNNPAMAILGLFGNTRITEVDVSNCPMLWALDCTYCPLTELDLTNNPNLCELNIDSTNISSLDLSNQSALRNLTASFTLLTELDLSSCTAIEAVTCEYNRIRVLDLSNNCNISADLIMAEGGGFIGGRLFPSPWVSNIYAYPEEGEVFLGWYDADGELISANDCCEVSGNENTVFIARFSGGGQPVPGDVDGDGEATLEDALLVMRCALELIELAPEQLELADMNGDGTIDLCDALLILRAAMGII